MSKAYGKRLLAVDRTILTPLVRRAAENEDLEITNWQSHPVEGGFGESFGLTRFQGSASAPGTTLNWSLILKATGPQFGSQDLKDHRYWKREPLVYRSGLLDDLPDGLVAPRCFGIDEFPDGQTWLWLEDVPEAGDPNWSFERFSLAARHLGLFNGGFLTGKPYPTFPWLSNGELRNWLNLAEAHVPALPALNELAVFAGLAPGDTIERTLKIWSQRECLMNVLDTFPQTLCHHDAARRNLASCRNADGRPQTAAFDWAFAGRGAIGEEIAPLFAVNLRFEAIDLDKIADLDRAIFAGYVEGLTDAGWRGDPRLPRFGYCTSAALKFGIAVPAVKWGQIAQRLAELPDGTDPPRLLGPGRAQSAAVRRHLLNMGEEALRLLERIG